MVSRASSSGGLGLRDEGKLCSRCDENKNTFVCVNKDRSLCQGSKSTFKDGNTWRTVEVEQGSIDEYAYQYNREIGCSVCVADSVFVQDPLEEQKAFVELKAEVAKKAAISAMNVAINTLKDTQKQEIDSMKSDVSKLDTKVDAIPTSITNAIDTAVAGLKAENVAFSEKVGEALSAISQLELSKPLAMCAGVTDPEDCKNIDCDGNSTSMCPGTCGTCPAPKAMLTTKNGKAIIQAGKVVVDNGVQDEIMTASGVEALVASHVAAAFKKAAEEF